MGILVVPSSLIDVITIATHHSANQNTEYRLWSAIVLCNLLLTIKFASNFVLYFSINKQFRHSIGQGLRRLSASRMTSRMTSRITTEETFIRVELMEKAGDKC